MMLDLGDTEDQIAEKTGFSKSTVRHRLNIAKLDQEKLKEKQQDDAFQLTLKDLYELEKIKDVEMRNEILDKASSSRDIVSRVQNEITNAKKYAGHEEEYPHYDNYDAIEVNRVVNIPCDYDGMMGVPITFLDKYDPDQFEIIGGFNNNHESDPAFGYVKSDMTPTISKGKEIMWNGPVVQKHPLYYRIVIRNKHPELPKGE